jgi:hypothetical protein
MKTLTVARRWTDQRRGLELVALEGEGDGQCNWAYTPGFSDRDKRSIEQPLRRFIQPPSQMVWFIFRRQGAYCAQLEIWTSKTLQATTARKLADCLFEYYQKHPTVHAADCK